MYIHLIILYTLIFYWSQTASHNYALLCKALAATQLKILTQRAQSTQRKTTCLLPQWSLCQKKD